MQQVNNVHKKEFEVFPDVIIESPGRLNIAGEHSWFFKDKTLSLAINLPVYIATSLRKDNILRFQFVHSDNNSVEHKKSNLTSLKYKREDRWANTIKAVIFGFNAFGYDIKSGFDVTVYSTIATTMGFGVTTAIKIGIAFAIRAMFNFDCDDEKLLDIVEYGTKRFLNIENILADNFTFLYGKENGMIITDYAKGSYEVVPFDFSEKNILVTDTKVPRINVWNESSLRQMENALLLGELKEHKFGAYGGWDYQYDGAEINNVLSVVKEESRHKLICIMKEHACVLDAISGLQKKDFGMFARAINHSHENMRDLFDISCPEVDWICKRIIEMSFVPDVHSPSACGRITGKGFGRCAYAILNSCDVPIYNQKIKEYDRIFGFKAVTYTLKSSNGIRILKS